MNPAGKLVIFGAGKIGRSFIGQLFSRGGFEVVFIDIYKPLIDELNRRGNYNVVIKAEKEEILNIKNVRGIYASDEDKVAEEISNATIAAVSVGLNFIQHIIPLLAKGLLKRFEEKGNLPLDIIIAENLRDAAGLFSMHLKSALPKDYPLENLAGLIETSIGKMVPIMLQKDLEEDMLQVFAEPYNTLILDKKAFKNDIPSIEGLSPKDNIKAWVDRKLFIHNLGHASAAYLGYLHNPDFSFLYEALRVPDICIRVRNTMLEAAGILLKMYPTDFSNNDLTEHIDDLLQRFQNVHLGDTIFRVGCDLYRKLGPRDRLAGAIHLALENNLPYDKILFALVCGSHFRAKDESGKMLQADVEFSKTYLGGIRNMLTEVCGFDETSNTDLYEKAERIDEQIK